MNIWKKTGMWIYLFIFLAFGVVYILVSSEQPATAMTKTVKTPKDFSQKYFPGAKVKEVYRLILDPGDFLLESIQELIKRENITDGAVLSGIGTLSECRMHWVLTTGFPSVQKKETLRKPLELLSVQGIIADSKPHLHISVSDTSHAVGGHLEEGCKVLYLVEMVIVSYEGTALTRRPNEHGTNMLQIK